MDKVFVELEVPEGTDISALAVALRFAMDFSSSEEFNNVSILEVHESNEE